MKTLSASCTNLWRRSFTGLFVALQHDFRLPTSTNSTKLDSVHAFARTNFYNSWNSVVCFWQNLSRGWFWVKNFDFEVNLLSHFLSLSQLSLRQSKTVNNVQLRAQSKCSHMCQLSIKAATFCDLKWNWEVTVACFHRCKVCVPILNSRFRDRKGGSRWNWLTTLSN